MESIQEVILDAMESIKYIKKSKKGKLIDLARMLKVDQSSIHRWRDGIYYPTRESVEAMHLIRQCGRELKRLTESYEEEFVSITRSYIERINRCVKQ